MKYIKIFIYVLCFTIYVYSCYMTSVKPNLVIWGYICALDFGVIFIFLVSAFTKHQKKKSENNQEEL